MGLARDEAGNIWETDAQGNPIRMRPPTGGQGRIISDPGQQEDRDFKRRDQQLQEQAAMLARLKAEADLRDATTKRTTTEARGGVDSSESERTAAFLATRVAGGIQDLARIGNIGAPSLKDALVGGTLLGNYSTDADRQRAINAQRDILDSALTLGTGAAYTQEQIDAYRSAYFPQPGDAPETIRDKTARLQRLLEASRLKAGAAAGLIDDALSASVKAPQGETVRYVQPTPDDGGLTGSVTDDSPVAASVPPPADYRDSIIGQAMSGVNEGIANTLGAPVDLTTMGMNLGVKGFNALTNSSVPEINRPFLGSEMLSDAMDGWGIYRQTNDPTKQFVRRAGQSVGAAYVPMAGAAGSLGKTAAGLGLSAGGGIGAATAQQVFPDNPVAELTGEILGSGLTAGALAASTRRAAMRKAMAAVPSRDELKQQASDLYQQAESRGVVAGPNVTSNLAGRFGKIADDEKLRWPNGNLDPNYKRAGASLDMMDAHAGQSIDPKQIQVLRDNLSDAILGTEGKEQRIARQMLKAFDEETVPLAPELAQARQTASRYLQSGEINRARDLAEVRAGQYGNSGMENALRTDFRALDRRIVKGEANFNPAAEEAIRNVARGRLATNALRKVGKIFAPSDRLGFIASGGTPFAIGTMIGGPELGAAASATTMGLGTAAKRAATRLTERDAAMADVLARNGGNLNIAPLLTPELEELLKRYAAGAGSQYIPGR